ncbi:acyl-CoA dehydrogenase family protein [Umezawaea endophytica]|uniref:Acyl-CoA dehydrogenase family protein n=1 Tax=Umezawaea endophytica TaxID=1654476 RepID=A0A9X3AFU4_9PSEU|nr:acyl-CoA dehydrogenase family protein [Umezawaea endophytica]MCS7479177.1 acyl-CoA dehydrogenase family protein [Umezawaea endophytica]
MSERWEEAVIETAELLIAAARTLTAEAAQAERDRRLTETGLTAVRASGAFALSAPRDCGGVDADLTTRVRVLAELGRTCPSTAWVVATTAETKIALQTVLSGRVRSEVFDDPDAVMCAAGPGRCGARRPASQRALELRLGM